MIRLISIQAYEMPMRTRMPFRYGIATLTALPHVVVRARVWVDGVEAEGLAADGLAPKWFTKNPNTTTEHDIAELWQVIDAAVANAAQVGEAETAFAWWQQLYAAQRDWAANRFPPLLWGFGVSLVERAVIDAVCRAKQVPFHQALAEDVLGIQLSTIHPSLRDVAVKEALPTPQRRIIARHTVGLGDPLTDAAISVAERVDDGLPQSLEACIRAYGLTHFKIKLCGRAEQDRARLMEIAALLEGKGDDYAFTLDGNEQFHEVEALIDLWRDLQTDAQLTAFMRHLLFVEQPLHRDVALHETTGAQLRAWAERPPIIIDESDGELSSLSTALRCGYAGTSHKNCKGVFKSVANACLASRSEGRIILSGEDLANVGPVALLQDLAVAATLGISHVERNGHHYFKGLSMWPADVQAAVLARHGDVYRRHEAGFPTLQIQDGCVVVDSLLDAPLGTSLTPDEVVRNMAEHVSAVTAHPSSRSTQ